MSRVTGVLIVLVLATVGIALRQQSDRRGDRILAGDALARDRVIELADACHGAEERGATPEELLAVLAEHSQLQALPELGDDYVTYARDAVAMYGLGLTAEPDPRTGRPRPGWVLRSWPVEYGVTGEVELHLDDLGVLWMGQNSVGRSGSEQGFPPDFPERDLGKIGRHWWQAADPHR